MSGVNRYGMHDAVLLPTCSLGMRLKLRTSIHMLQRVITQRKLD